MNRRVAIVVVVASWAVVSSSGASALAQECTSLLDTCAEDTIPVDPDEVLDDPVGTISDTLDGAEETTDPVSEPIVDAVDDLLGGGGIVDPPGGDGPARHGSGPRTRVRGREGSATDRSSERRPAAATVALVRESVRPPVTLIGTAASGTRPPIAPHGAPGRLEGVFEGAVRGLLLLAVLFGVTIAFVLIQGRFDRNDPKLARAPVRAEVVSFG